MLCPYLEILSASTRRSLCFLCSARFRFDSSDSNALTLAAAMQRRKRAQSEARWEWMKADSLRTAWRKTVDLRKLPKQNTSQSAKAACYLSRTPNRIGRTIPCRMLPQEVVPRSEPLNSSVRDALIFSTCTKFRRFVWQEITNRSRKSSTRSQEESSARHARDLGDMKRVARDAHESTGAGRKRQCKREQFNETATRKGKSTAERPRWQVETQTKKPLLRHMRETAAHHSKRGKRKRITHSRD